MSRNIGVPLLGVAIALAAFCGGICYVAAGAPIPSWLVMVAHGSGFKNYDSITGTITTVDEHSVTLMLSNGDTATFPIDQSTLVLLAPIPKSIADVKAGSTVLVVMPVGEAVAPAQMIQILSNTQ